MLAAADPAAQLVQLADAEPVGVHHEHHRRVGHVDTDLDHGGTHQDVDLAGAERRHHGVLLVGGEPAVHQAEPQPGQRPVPKMLEQLDDGGGRSVLARSLPSACVALVDARGDDVGLAARVDLFDDALPRPVQPRAASRRRRSCWW